METSPSKLDLSAMAPGNRGAVDALMASNTKLAEINKRQEAVTQDLRHALHGETPEWLAKDVRQLSFEDLEVAVAKIEEAACQTPKSRKKPAPFNRNLSRLPAELPRVERVIEPEYRTPCHRSGAAACHRHRPAEIRLPGLHRR